MLENILRIFLSFSHEIVIIPIIILGFIWWDRKIFCHAIILLFSSIIINYALKISFKIPLNPSLNKIGYAFPSGHMQSAAVFYGWLLYNFTNKFLKISCLVTIIIIGIALNYFNYHNFYDVFAALVVAFVMVYIAIKLSTKSDNLLLVLSLIVSIISLLYINYNTDIPRHLWSIFMAFTSFLGAFWVFNAKNISQNRQKFYAIFICFGFIIAINYIFTILDVNLIRFKWAIMCFFVPFSTFIVSKYNVHKRLSINKN